MDVLNSLNYCYLKLSGLWLGVAQRTYTYQGIQMSSKNHEVSSGYGFDMDC